MTTVSDSVGDARGLYSDFEGYQTPSQQDLLSVLRDGVLALDANVLLDLYRYGETARDEFFALLEAVQQVLWVPHQVVKEFWRNRASVLADVGAAAQVPDLKKARDFALTALGRWRALTRADVEADASMDLIRNAFDAVAAKLTPVSGLDAEAIALDTNVDSVLARLQPLLEGRVGRAPDEDRLARLVKMGVERFERNEPPGYLDARKHGQSELGTGDFLLWSELLERARVQRTNVLLVTRDEKEDWWLLDSKRRLIGPKVELVDEMLRETGSRFFLLRPEQFLSLAGGLGVRVAAETIEDASRLSRAAEPPSEAPALWTRDELSTDGWVRHSNAASLTARALADRVADAVRGDGTVAFRVESGPNYASVHLPGSDVPSDALLSKIRPMAEAAGLDVVFLDQDEVMSALIDPQSG